MAISPLKRVYITALSSDRGKIFEALQKAGIIHIEDNLAEEIQSVSPFQKKDDSIQKLEYELTRAEHILEYLLPYEKKKKFFESFDESIRTVTYKELTEALKKADLDKLYDECYALGQKLKEYAAEENEIKSELTRIEPYLNLPVPMEKIRDTADIYTRIGVIEAAGVNDFVVALNDASIYHELFKIEENILKYDYFVVFYHKSVKDDIEKVFSTYGFHPEEFSFKTTFGEKIEQLKAKLQEIISDRKEIEKQSSSLSAWLDRVRICYDYLIMELERKRAEELIYKTSETFIIKGWIRKADSKTLNEILSKVTAYYDVLEQDPGPDEDVPVELSNSTFTAPGEFITTLYSYPNYREYDPTPFFYIFYVLFFAICLTDAGYGIIIAISIFTAMKLMKPKGDAAKLLTVLFYGGLLTILTGALTMGWFGIPVDSLPAFLKNLGWFDPMKDSLLFLSIALYLGVGQLVWGYLVGAWFIIKRRKQDMPEAVERILTAVFFTCLAPLAISGGLIGKPPAGEHILQMLVVVSITLIFLKKIVQTFLTMPHSSDKKQKVFIFLTTLLNAIIGNLVLGIAKMVIDFSANVLSYSRLMALGLCTGGIGLSVNLLAGVARDLLGNALGQFVGLFFAALILVGGHLFNIAISTLGAFVHSARLQYVEFFPYFFEGGGKPFTPLAIKTKYNYVTDFEN
ncbi:MAG: V-type ATP synthase subunit I [Firmicutes bacterium]|nr:V-type ATP synthase subunit I [Bacillota bacterium]